ncbi:MAG: electron transfer flavoprotein subunit alpha/FixB family protein [Trueperaceae bacterium]
MSGAERGPVLVWVDVVGTEPTRGALQAIDAARRLAAAAGTHVHGVAAGEDAQVAARYLPTVHRIDALPDGHDARVRAWHASLDGTGATMFVVAGTRTALAVAPRVAVRAGGAYLEEAVTLTVEDGQVVAERLTQLQRVTERLVAEATSAVVTVKVGAFAEAEPAEELGSVEVLDVVADERDRRVTVRPHEGGSGAAVALEEADVVVAGGRGLGSAEAFDTLVIPLAERLGGAVGATRAVVDAEWRPYGEQIGQTGKTVAPTVYLALGISGAVQHMSGMNRSRWIVAINADADAPIFQQCDVGVINDVHAVVPELMKALEER